MVREPKRVLITWLWIVLITRTGSSGIDLVIKIVSAFLITWPGIKRNFDQLRRRLCGSLDRNVLSQDLSRQMLRRTCGSRRASGVRQSLGGPETF